ncbi:hypothetical protein FOCC_FOCC017330 [Frankliniella occidentalis]|nr:hypothetical protein FOCC_FOCC017330 [Frankliniella occidentalis]
MVEDEFDNFMERVTKVEHTFFKFKNTFPEDFMAQVEKDAQRRAKDRKERKQRSDELKAKANKAFREKKFEEALDLYSKAIDETRDSALLFENRALTYLHLELFQRVVKDCESALGLNANSLKVTIQET